MNPLREVGQFGQSLWLDNLSRTILKEGTLKRMIEEDGISGLTSNPSIFHKAVSESPYYRDQLATLKASTPDVEARYEALAIPDIQAACDLMRPVFDKTNGDDGYVSLEVSPKLAADEAGTVAAALRLKKAVGRDNLLIKVPATPQGVRAVEHLIGQGVSVNVTLMFSLHHEMEVAQAYIRGLKKFAAAGGDVRKIKSVASIFLSRVDTLVDKKLDQIGSPEALALRGKSAVAMCKLAYQRFKDLFHGHAFAELAAQGGRPQYPLWASTGTKNPAYSDVLYVEPLIGPQTVNTVPDATIVAFRDHGKAASTLEQGVEDAKQHYLALERLGIDMNSLGEQLQEEGVKLFDEAYSKLLQLVS
jgi:transaldolase